MSPQTCARHLSKVVQIFIGFYKFVLDTGRCSIAAISTVHFYLKVIQWSDISSFLKPKKRRRRGRKRRERKNLCNDKSKHILDQFKLRIVSKLVEKFGAHMHEWTYECRAVARQQFASVERTYVAWFTSTHLQWSLGDFDSCNVHLVWTSLVGFWPFIFFVDIGLMKNLSSKKIIFCWTTRKSDQMHAYRHLRPVSLYCYFFFSIFTIHSTNLLLSELSMNCRRRVFFSWTVINLHPLVDI